jgi:uncharacterized surface protein with fasciclin (FAS1) repeats
MRIPFLRTGAAAAVLAAFALLGARAEDQPAAGKTVLELATADKDFSTFVTALKAADLADTLQGPGPFTVLAPTNEAFARIPEAQLRDLLRDREKLTKVLKAHVIGGDSSAAEVKKLDGKTVKTLAGDLPVKADGGTVTVGKAKVVKADVKASNGVIHVIDTVLTPE